METLMIDAIVIILLSATILFAYRLDRKLQSVRDIQTDLSHVIRELNAAAARAEAGIQGLKIAAQSSGHDLDEQIRRARNAGDELSNLLHMGDRIGERLAPQQVTGSVIRQNSRPAFDALRALSGQR